MWYLARETKCSNYTLQYKILLIHTLFWYVLLSDCEKRERRTHGLEYRTVCSSTKCGSSCELIKHNYIRNFIILYHNYDLSYAIFMITNHIYLNCINILIIGRFSSCMAVQHMIGIDSFERTWSSIRAMVFFFGAIT